MPMPLKLNKYEIPSFILHNFIIPYAEQCYLVSVEYHYIDLNKLLILLLKDCSSVNGSVHLNINNVISNLIRKYKIVDSNIEMLIQSTLELIYRELQSYFYNRVELTLSKHNR
jgi:hypothetical protein